MCPRAEAASSEVYRLPDDALLVRGGIMRAEDLVVAAETATEQLGRPGLTVWGGEGMQLEDVIRAVGPKLEVYAQVMWTTAGSVRTLAAEGYVLEKTLASPLHYTIFLPGVHEHAFDQLRQKFVGPQPNPLFRPKSLHRPR